ncbi:MAG: helix-turn-helix domain-containing protein [Chitinivibrionales bacterium]
MSISQLLKNSRETADVTPEELSRRLGIPIAILRCIEQPEAVDEQAVALFAAALGITPEQFRGEKPVICTEKKIASSLRQALYPAVREYIVDSSRCKNPESALALFGNDPFSLAEKNLVLYLSTTALYHFCDTNTSSFAFDSYLFRLHQKLLGRFENALAARAMSAELKQQHLNSARSNIFCCEKMENIAVMILDDFAVELEKKLTHKDLSFEDELSMPLTWQFDEELMHITISDAQGESIDTIKLLDVRKPKAK